LSRSSPAGYCRMHSVGILNSKMTVPFDCVKTMTLIL